MNLYAASFPHFVGKKFTTGAAERADLGLQELKRICTIWKLGEEWLGILESARSLFSRITSNKPAHTVRKSRYDYPELEDSIIMATVRGMPGANATERAQIGEEIEAGSEVSLIEAHDGEDGQDDFVTGQSEVIAVCGSEYMDEDDWKLWSFWDDPHLLSTVDDFALT